MNAASMLFDFETVRWLVTAAVGAYTWFIGRQSASAAELLVLRTRITKLEVEMSQMPKQQDIHQLAKDVAIVNGSVEAIRASLDPLTHSVRRVEQYLMDNK